MTCFEHGAAGSQQQNNSDCCNISDSEKSGAGRVSAKVSRLGGCCRNIVCSSPWVEQEHRLVNDCRMVRYIVYQQILEYYIHLPNKSFISIILHIGSHVEHMGEKLVKNTINKTNKTTNKAEQNLEHAIFYF